MAAEPLRADLKQAGRDLLDILDGLELGVQGAGWVYFHDLEEWRFYISTPLLESMGRKRVYSLLADALDKILLPDGLTIFDIHLEDHNGPLFRMISSIIRVADGEIVFGNNTIDGILVDGFFYRMDRPKALQGIALKKAENAFRKRVKQVA